MKIVLSGTMLRFANYNRRIEVEAHNVAAAIQSLTDTYPALKRALLDGQGQLRGVHRLFLNSEMLLPGEMERPLQADDQLDIITAVAGG